MPKPRVMIDGYNLAMEKGTGIATYARNLSVQLTQLGHKVDLLYGLRTLAGKNDLLAEVGFFDPSRRPTTAPEVLRRLATSPFGVRAKQVPITGKIIATNLKENLPTHDRIYNASDLFGLSYSHFRTYGRFLTTSYETTADVAHWTYPLPVKLKNAANIYTIHDLVPLRLPYTTLDNKKEFFRIVKRICDHADHIVTVSEVSKRDIIELMGVDASRVTNTYQAASLPAHIVGRDEDEVINDVESLFSLEHKKYFLFFGAIEPKKNVGRIVEAYLASHVKEPLVIVGQMVWKNSSDLRLLGIKSHNSSAGDANQVADATITTISRASSIVRLEYLPLGMLTSLIRCARAVVFPSLYEGFGLPVLEAMQLRTAVITGSEGANPEIAGDGAYIVDPYNVAAITRAIRELANDDHLLHHYEELGSERAKLFSPEKYSERLANLYEKVL